MVQGVSPGAILILLWPLGVLANPQQAYGRSLSMVQDR